MDYAAFLALLARTLEQCGKDYFVTGGIAVSVWGHPRSTYDIDVVIAINESQVPLFVRTMKEMSDTLYVDEQMIVEEIRRGGEFNVIDGTTGMKVDFFVMQDDAYGRVRNERKVAKEIDGQRVFFISPEDLVLSKLLWSKHSGSEKQTADVQSVIEMMGDDLDWEYLHSWEERLGVVVEKIPDK